MGYTRNDTAGTEIDPGTVETSPVQPQVSNGTKDNVDEVEVQTGLTMASELTHGTVHVRERSRSPRRHGEEPFGFRVATLWC